MRQLHDEHYLNGLRRYGWVLAMLCLTACSMTPSMKKAPVRPIDISGLWSLDRRESDDVRGRLQPLIDKAETKWRKNERRMQDRIDGDVILREPGGDRLSQGVDNSTMQWIREQRHLESKALIAFVSPASQLDIRQTPRDIRFSSDKGEGSRLLTPGEESALFVAMGGFTVSSGWQGTSFVVDSSGSGDNPIHVVERYTLMSPDTEERLEERVEVRLPNLGKQAFRFVYKRKRP